MQITLTPAYGRDYKSKKAVLEDWNANKDFIINHFGHPYDGKPINKQDAAAAYNDTFYIRYHKLTKVMPV